MTPARAANTVVDHQAHWYPRSILDEETRKPDARVQGPDAEGTYVFTLRPGGYSAPLPRAFYDLEVQLESMTRNGIDVAVLSANVVSDVTGLEAGRAQHVAEACNHALGDAQRAHPGRIYSIAMLPVEHPERALQTLDRAITDEGLRGVCLLSNIGRGPIVNDGMEPVYARIAELGVPIFLHPANESMVSEQGLLDVVDVGAGWMLDTTAAALTLIYSGLLDRHPSLTVVHPHLGGMLPFVLGRIPACLPPEIEHPLEWYLRTRFYVDSAGDTPGALPLTAATYGLDRIVYASDWPWFAHEHSDAVLDGHGDPDAVEQIKANRIPGLLPGA